MNTLNYSLIEFSVLEEPCAQFAVHPLKHHDHQEMFISTNASSSSTQMTPLTVSVPPSALLNTSAYASEDNAGNMSDCTSVDESSIDTDLQTVVTWGGAASPARSSICSERTAATLSPKVSTTSSSTISAQNQQPNATDEIQSDASMASEASRRTEAIRKLLTETTNSSAGVLSCVIRSSTISTPSPSQPQPLAFQRNSGGYRSYRTEKSKADDLDYITSRYANVVFLLFIVTMKDNCQAVLHLCFDHFLLLNLVQEHTCFYIAKVRIFLHN